MKVWDGTAWVGDQLVIPTTGYWPLPIPGGVAPDQSGTNNDPATPQKIVSSGTQTTNSPKVTYHQLNFSAGVKRHWLWQVKLPGDYASGGILRFSYINQGTDVTSVTWKGATAFGINDTSDMDSLVFDTVVTQADTPIATAGGLSEVAITLNMTNAAPNRAGNIMLGRDADSNTADMAVLAAYLEYQKA